METSHSARIIHQYLAGELSVAEAGELLYALQVTGSGPEAASIRSASPEQREKVEALFGFVLWRALQDSVPESAPATPFDAADFRRFMDTAQAAADAAPGPDNPGGPRR